MKIELRPVHPSFGAEVVGVDPAGDLDETITTIQDAWTNRCTQHCATEFDETRHRRRMHWTTLEGELPRLARSPRPRPGRPPLSLM